jgi:hypothetical protein
MIGQFEAGGGKAGQQKAAHPFRRSEEEWAACSFGLVDVELLRMEAGVALD